MDFEMLRWCDDPNPFYEHFPGISLSFSSFPHNYLIEIFNLPCIVSGKHRWSNITLSEGQILVDLG